MSTVPPASRPADPTALAGIQKALNETGEAWADAPDPKRQANATCPGCGQAAEHTTQDLADAGFRQETWRCLADGPRCRPTVKHSDIPAREETPMSENLCPCGCEAEVKPGNKFADRSCAPRVARANGVRCGRQKSSPTPAGEHAPTQPDQPPSGEGDAWKKCSACSGSGIVAGANEYTTDRCQECDGKGGWLRQHDYLTPEQQAARATPPPIADPLDKPKLCDCGCGRPCLGVRRWATNECNPVASPHAIAKAYLRKLTPEGRQALLDLVAAEERCSELGVA